MIFSPNWWRLPGRPGTLAMAPQLLPRLSPGSCRGDAALAAVKAATLFDGAANVLVTVNTHPDSHIPAAIAVARTCQHHESQQWIERQRAKLLPCSYS